MSNVIVQYPRLELISSYKQVPQPGFRISRHCFFLTSMYSSSQAELVLSLHVVNKFFLTAKPLPHDIQHFFFTGMGESSRPNFILTILPHDPISFRWLLAIVQSWAIVTPSWKQLLINCNSVCQCWGRRGWLMPWFFQFNGRFVQIHGRPAQIDVFGLLFREFGQIFHEIGEIFRESGKLILFNSSGLPPHFTANARLSPGRHAEKGCIFCGGA